MFSLLQKQKETSLLINGFCSPAPFLINGFHNPDRLDVDCKSDGILIYISSLVIRQKGESQNGCFKKKKYAKFSEKRTFLTP